ncbi:hypothetical protein [Dysgonomonas sp. 520]|uniref:hypothetical protein n=1 Tax=Dysgonomonas sp. 520 TaxID=2302931 RepID=UPI0013D5D882|nr:hypothetical protein [Dysgonomonas sp. 520]NDW09503.1 hypothetical protein [Dysgonomonas sp. 520]
MADERVIYSNINYRESIKQIKDLKKGIDDLEKKNIEDSVVYKKASTKLSHHKKDMEEFKKTYDGFGKTIETNQKKINDLNKNLKSMSSKEKDRALIQIEAYQSNIEKATEAQKKYAAKVGYNMETPKKVFGENIKSLKEYSATYQQTLKEETESHKKAKEEKQIAEKKETENKQKNVSEQVGVSVNGIEYISKAEKEAKEKKDAQEKGEKPKRNWTEEADAIRTFHAEQLKVLEEAKEKELSIENLTSKQKQDIQKSYNNTVDDLNLLTATKAKQLMEDANESLDKDNKIKKSFYEVDLENKKAALKAGSMAALKITLEELRIKRENEIAEAEKTEADVVAINAKYNALMTAETEKNLAAEIAANAKAYEEKIKQAGTNKVWAAELKLQQLQQDKEITQLYYEEGLIAKEEFAQKLNGIDQSIEKSEDDLLKARWTRIDEITGHSQKVFSALSDLIVNSEDDEKKSLEKKKKLAWVQVALDTAKAISAAVVAAQGAGPFPANVIAIAPSIAAVMTSIATAKKTIKEADKKIAEFAEGGLVTGPGSGTSDSIPTFLSNGESVLTASATSLFGPVLSAFNQLGGGVPIPSGNITAQVMGEEMLAKSFARALEQMPNPVVSVEEINNTNKRIQVLEQYRTL